MTGLTASKSRRRSITLLTVATALLTIPIACRKANNPDKATGNTNGLSHPDEAHCASLTNSAIDMLQPDRLGISARTETAISVLNQWGDRCGNLSTRTISLEPESTRFLKTRLEEETFSRLSESHFTQQDGQHIRNCLLSRRQAEFLTRPGHDLDHVMHLFEYVIRNVALVDDALPLSPYQILLFGRGTPRDRAWVFANLLRQLRIDAVILRPGSKKTDGKKTGSSKTDAEKTDAGKTNKADSSASTSSSNKPDPRWLIGVLLDSDVYLFDPRLGTGIPSAREKADGIRSFRVQQPATLAEVQADGTLLTNLSVSKMFPYPLTANDLHNPKVELIADAKFWSPRMEQLQASLSGERTVIVYDGPTKNSEAGSGLLARVRGFAGRKWDPQSVGLWEYPEQVSRQIANPSDEQAGRRRVLEAPFAVPFQPERNEKGHVVLLPEHLQRKTRISQILGQYRDAMKSYLFVRTHADIPVRSKFPPEIRRYHVRAGEDAAYWGGLCQMEEGDYATAINTFIAYVKRYRTRAVWLSSTRGLLADCFARQKDYDRAIRSIKNLPADDPYKPAYQLMVRRLETLKASEAKSKK